MRMLWKVLLTLVVVLPLGGFVAGSLAASGPDDPSPRETIVVRDAPTRPPAAADPSPARPSSAATPVEQPPDDLASDGPEVVTPSLDDLGDDHGGDRGGHGSGHGGGHGSDDSGGGSHG